MDGKIKTLAVASIIAVMASGCSSYRGASQGTGGGYSTSGGTTTSSGTGGLFGQRAGTGQVAGGGFGQRSTATCAPCGTATKQPSTYTYTPAKPAAPAAPKAQTGQYDQQYYIDKWNREQAAQKAQQNTTNYAGYGTAPANSTTYYDYSSAGKTNDANVATSNKSIYTGSYQQKTYKPYAPTTYSGGSAATTGTAAYANTVGTSSAAGGSTYTVKKGDTVFEIMRQTGVYWKDIISMNNLQPPYNINPGQTLRLK